MGNQTIVPLKENSVNKTSERLLSIDTLRGLDMFMLVWGTDFFGALFLVLYPPLGEILALQFEHSAWNGFTYYDLIFPLFLFISGVSIPFSITKRLERGDNQFEIYKHVFKRTILLFALGFLYNNINKLGDPVEWRIMGVLQRFSLCNLFASLIVMNIKPKGQALITAGLLLGYWAMMVLIPVPGYGAGVLTQEGNLAGYIDRLLLPNPDAWCCYRFGDSEGLLSTIPAIGTCLLGVFTGQILRSEKSQTSKCLRLLIFGGISIGLAFIWDLSFPINKYLWSSSFVLLTGGISIISMAILYTIIDIWGIKRWTIIFIVIGMNSILIYVLNDLIGIVLGLALISSFYKNKSYKKIGFWILWVLIITVAAIILFVPGVIDRIIFVINTIGENNLLTQTIGLVYGYLCLVFCYKKKWFFKV